ncbi:hypothetical protein Tco_1440940 [Tanacetum coccineum]
MINVCFADDLFIFARGDVESSRVIMDSLEEFKLTSRLIPSIPKSTLISVMFCLILKWPFLVLCLLLKENSWKRIFKKEAKNDQTKHGMEKTK